MAISGNIRVTPQELRNASTQLGQSDTSVSNLTQQMMDIVNQLNSTWAGEAANTYYNKLRGLQGDMTKLHKTANVCVATDAQMLSKTFNEGDILVTTEVTMDMIPVLKKASGIVSEEKGESSNAVILAMALDIPVITEATGATKILKSGTTITIDGGHGLVYSGTENLL